MIPPSSAEWLEPDGLGGFASGTAGLVRTRRYHALLLTSTASGARFALVPGLDAHVETASGRHAISQQRYASGDVAGVPPAGGVDHPDGARRIVAFQADPRPMWRFRLDDGTEVEQTIRVPRGVPAVVIAWRRLAGAGAASLIVRPFFAGRDYHSLHHENPVFRFDPEVTGDLLVFRPYPGVPATVALSSGAYTHAPCWVRHFLYEEERARGLDHEEDLAAPGEWRFDLAAGPCALALCVEGSEDAARLALRAMLSAPLVEFSRPRAPSERLLQAADAYVVRTSGRSTIVAGYPWFTDWGRDTFIAMRGLLLATGRLAEARAILLDWATTVSEGMVPNRFPDAGSPPEFNSVDASLWFVVAGGELLERVASADDGPIREALLAIVAGYARGTRYGIRQAADGLLACGAPGLQLTWMDARCEGRCVTPRMGKPVEVQALWINALRVAGRFDARWTAEAERAEAAFGTRFWDEEHGRLFDVVDDDHREGACDTSFRPNQLLAIGGLPHQILLGERARRVVLACEERLCTPLGMRTLSPGDPRYVGHYAGGPSARDAVYHQGTAWPWLLGPFVEAWVRVRGNTPGAIREARGRFLEPLLAHLDVAGLGHLPEIADGDWPHAPRGCPFQAWSVGEALRLDREVLRE